VLLALEPNETTAEGVYRYLEGVVAWPVALVHQLLNSKLLKELTTISVGVILFMGFRSDVMSVDGVISGLLKRYPNEKDLI
jgi:hypothetical protein